MCLQVIKDVNFQHVGIRQLCKKELISNPDELYLNYS